jgi:hypothetical protein
MSQDLFQQERKATKRRENRYKKIFLPPHVFLGSGIRDPGSGMWKNPDPGSGINIPDPQHCMQRSNLKPCYIMQWRDLIPSCVMQQEVKSFCSKMLLERTPEFFLFSATSNSGKSWLSASKCSAKSESWAWFDFHPHFAVARFDSAMWHAAECYEFLLYYAVERLTACCIFPGFIKDFMLFFIRT